MQNALRFPKKTKQKNQKLTNFKHFQITNTVRVWIQVRFPLLLFLFFFALAAIVDQVNSEQCICALFMIPQTSFFSNVFIKNGSHGTIHTVKNYFATVFSVFSFSKINYIQTNL